MIRYADQMKQEKREHMRDGDGTVTLTPAFEAEDIHSKTRLFSRITLPVGASIGFHTHDNEEEFYYFLSGMGEFNDNGELHTIQAGDATVTGCGKGHAVRNTGNVPLEMLAVIVKFS